MHLFNRSQQFVISPDGSGNPVSVRLLRSVRFYLGCFASSQWQIETHSRYSA